MPKLPKPERKKTPKQIEIDCMNAFCHGVDDSPHPERKNPYNFATNPKAFEAYVNGRDKGRIDDQ